MRSSGPWSRCSSNWSSPKPARRSRPTAGTPPSSTSETLGLPEPARALGYRGAARAFLGDAGGLVEMERALALLLERGAGQEAAVLQNNLAITRYPLQGAARSLAAFEDAIIFCEQRGL